MATKDYARIDRLYSVMVELLNQPKTIDVMRKMPGYVKDGIVYDFNDRPFGDTDKPDGPIFKDVERVKTVQAVTAALKRDYTKALQDWLGTTDEAEPTAKAVKATKDAHEPETEEKAKKSKKDKKKGKEETAPVETADLVASIKILIGQEEFKKAKKLLKNSKEDDGYKKAKKLLKIAMDEE